MIAASLKTPPADAGLGSGLKRMRVGVAKIPSIDKAQVQDGSKGACVEQIC